MTTTYDIFTERWGVEKTRRIAELEGMVRDDSNRLIDQGVELTNQGNRIVELEKQNAALVSSGNDQGLRIVALQNEIAPFRQYIAATNPEDADTLEG